MWLKGRIYFQEHNQSKMQQLEFFSHMHALENLVTLEDSKMFRLYHLTIFKLEQTTSNMSQHVLNSARSRRIIVNYEYIAHSALAIKLSLSLITCVSMNSNTAVIHRNTHTLTSQSECGESAIQLGGMCLFTS